MTKEVITCLFFLFATNSFAGSDPQYPVKDIPEVLLENAHIVYREDKAHFEILGIDKASYKIRQVITILNKTGKDHAVMATSYDKLRKVTTFSARVYDKDGKEIHKLKKSEIIDRSYIDGGTLYDDSRIMAADLSQKEYPYTVAYEIELNFKYLYSIPDWIVQSGENDAIQYSEYKITAPVELMPRYKQINFNTAPTHLKSDSKEELTWSFKNIQAVKFEPLSKGYLDVSPIIRVAPNRFKFDDYEGSMESWDDIAKWQNSLNKDRDNLSQERINEVKSLVNEDDSKTEKIRTIYEYMQKRTRYVSIQLGIGGFQPFESKIVDEMGYGDCKALSFYTKSLLEAVGIDAYYTWVYGGSNPPVIDPLFPDDTFNHIILCVPVAQDTVWLECTSQINPMGYLGAFTGDRDVLVITEEGGKIVHTPTYDHEKNAIKNSANIKIDEEGNAGIQLQALFVGKGYEYKGLDYYITLTEKDHKDWLNKYLVINNYQIIDYSFDQKKGMIPEITLDLNLSVRKLASVSNKRIFFAPSVLHPNTYIPPKKDSRSAPIYISSSRLTKDSIQFTLPTNFRIEYLPENTEVNTEFGVLKVEYTKTDNNSIIFKRTLRLNKGKYAPDRYEDLISFFKEVAKVDKRKIVLNKST